MSAFTDDNLYVENPIKSIKKATRINKHNQVDSTNVQLSMYKYQSYFYILATNIQKYKFFKNIISIASKNI